MSSKSYFVDEIPRRVFLQKSIKGGLALAATPALMSSLLSCNGSSTPVVKLDLDPQLLNRTIMLALLRADGL